jgi:hypothetical protein
MFPLGLREPKEITFCYVKLNRQSARDYAASINHTVYECEGTLHNL